MKFTTHKTTKGKGYNVVCQSSDGREFGVSYGHTKASARKYISRQRYRLAHKRPMPRGGY